MITKEQIDDASEEALGTTESTDWSDLMSIFRRGVEWTLANMTKEDFDFAVWCQKNYQRVEEHWEQGGVEFSTEDLKQIYSKI